MFNLRRVKALEELVKKLEKEVAQREQELFDKDAIISGYKTMREQYSLRIRELMNRYENKVALTLPDSLETWLEMWERLAKNDLTAEEVIFVNRRFSGIGINIFEKPITISIVELKAKAFDELVTKFPESRMVEKWLKALTGIFRIEQRDLSVLYNFYIIAKRLDKER